MSKKILIIDDSRVAREVIQDDLEEEGFEVLQAGSGEDAMDIIYSDNKPDVILLDIMMPGMEGDMFCRLIKGRDESRNIPIILVSTKDEKELQELVEEVGADDYMWKAKVNAHELKKIIYKHSW